MVKRHFSQKKDGAKSDSTKKDVAEKDFQKMPEMWQKKSYPCCDCLSNSTIDNSTLIF